MEVDLHVSSVAKLSIVTDNNDISFKSDTFLNYDADSANSLPTFEEVDDSSTDDSFSAGNTNPFPNHTSFELEFEEPRYNYHGPKIVVPRRECPVTICTADTIGTVKSRRLLRVLFDSSLTVSMIKRSVLPPKLSLRQLVRPKTSPRLLENFKRRKL